MLKKKLQKTKESFRSLKKLPENPHAIAMGAAIGMFWNFIPSLGIGPIVSLIAAKLLRASKAAAVTVNVATGFFIPFFYSLNVITGRSIPGGKPAPFDIGGKVQESITNSLGNISEFIEEPSNYFFINKIQSLSVDFLVGSMINAVLAAIIVYFLFLIILRRRNKLLLQRSKPENNKDTPDKTCESEN